MLEFFRYLHYRLYTWDIKTWGKNNISDHHALIGVTFMLCANILSAILLFCLIIGIDPIQYLKIPKLLILLQGALVYLISYYLFNHEKKYLMVCRRYAHESKKTRRRKLFYLWLYVVVSFGLSIALPMLLRFVK